jgi:succinate dehydrogenase hydrophobic anchor subunit
MISAVVMLVWTAVLVGYAAMLARSTYSDEQANR